MIPLPFAPADPIPTLDASLGQFGDGLLSVMEDFWPVAAPWLSLRVGFELFMWWLSWRAARRQPQQLALF